MKSFSPFKIFTLFAFLLSLISYLVSPSFSFAQIATPLSSSDISVDINPTNPGSNEQALITVSSFATDLDSVNISWLVNGKKVQSGVGDKSLTVTTGNIGQKINVDIEIDSVTGEIDKTLTIIPASVDLVWEAHTYTPPFFKGKALFTDQSNITFIAVPHILRNGIEVPAQNLVYSWSNNGTVLGDQGGYGKSTLTIAGSILPRPMDITVEATDPESGDVADGETVVTPGTPTVLLYQNDPLYGVEYNKAITGTFSLSGAEVDLTAVPYYFSATSLSDSALTYNWQINGTPLGDGVNGATKAFRRIGDETGSSNVSVGITQNNTLFQTANASIGINFTSGASQVSAF